MTKKSLNSRKAFVKVFVATLLGLGLFFASTAESSLAWLTLSSGPVTNTFESGKINTEIKEQFNKIEKKYICIECFRFCACLCSSYACLFMG